MKNIKAQIGRLICRLFHKHISSHPIQGAYKCFDCGRSWPSPWE